MRKILILAVATAVLCSCGNKNGYVIRGSAPEGTLYLYADMQVVDSAVVKEGKFRFEGTVPEEPVRNLADAGRPEEVTRMTLVILEPGTITIRENPDSPREPIATGTPANDAKTAYDAAGRALFDEYRSEGTTDERRKAIEQEYAQLGRTHLEQNRDNYFGIMLLKELAYGLSGQELLDEIAKFPAAMLQNGVLAELRELAEAKRGTDIGQPYTDIEQNDPAGKPVSLRSVIENPANKYVLLDFWASWCGPCMGEVPHLKEAYEQFRAKGFEIYGVSFDNDRERWLGAVEANGMNWVQVSELEGFDNPAARDYAVQGIPANFLIETDSGRIVATNLRGERLKEKLAELLEN